MESLNAQSHLYQTVTADTAVQAVMGSPVPMFYGKAPEGTPLPYIMFYTADGSSDDVLTGIGAYRIKTDMLYQVKIAFEGNSAAVYAAVADRIYGLLHKSRSVLNNVLSCVRISTLDYVSTDEGTTYRYLGGIYRLEVR